jgi:hypothetical protein
METCQAKGPYRMTLANVLSVKRFKLVTLDSNKENCFVEARDIMIKDWTAQREGFHPESHPDQRLDGIA